MFEGFLPVNRKQQKERLAEILQEKRTVIFYEAPHELRTTLDLSLIHICLPQAFSKAWSTSSTL